MCSEKSRIPVLSFQERKVIHVPEEQQPLLPSKKYINRTANLEPHRDHTFAFGAKAPENIVFKGATQGVTKIVPPPAKKATVQCPVSRSRREAELRNKNKLLEASKSEMMVKLEKMQGTIKELKKQCESLQKENQELKQFQKCCMLVLETHNCLSDAGNRILEKEEETKEEQAELMTSKITWKQVEEERLHFREKQQCFRREMEEFAAILDQEDEFVTELETPIRTLL